MTKEQIRNHLVESAINTIVGYIIKDKGYNMLDAMKALYESPIMKWLQDEEDDLYTQSPAHIYEVMKKYAA